MLEFKYFVLKPKGNDSYAYASRQAMLAYAKCIMDEDIALSDDLIKWVTREEEVVLNDNT